MTNKRRGLGRHLEALLSVNPQQMMAPAEREEQLIQIPIQALRPSPYQPRKIMDSLALEELAESIKAQGLIQPIIVRQPTSTAGYEIIAGERRWRAAEIAGLGHIPAVVKTVSDQSAMALALIENIQREDLNPLEEAVAIQRLIEDCELTHQAVADALGKSRVAITHLLALLELADEVKHYLGAGELDKGHAKALMSLPKSKQVALAKIIVEKGLSVRQTEALVQSERQPKPIKKAVSHEVNTADLLRQLSEKLGAKIDLKANPKGQGKLVIFYNNLDELEGILSHIH